MKVSEKEHKKQKVLQLFRYRCTHIRTYTYVHRHTRIHYITYIILHIKPFSPVALYVKQRFPHSSPFTPIHSIERIINIAVTKYGSIFAAGRLSSKYPYPALCVLLLMRTDTPLSPTPHVNVL